MYLHKLYAKCFAWLLTLKYSFHLRETEGEKDTWTEDVRELIAPRQNWFMGKTKSLSMH